MQILANAKFSIQMLVMIAFGHDTKGWIKSNEPNEKPIHYLSHKLTVSQTNWPTIEKECFSIFYTLQKLDQFLHDSEFVIRKDHKLL